MIRVLYIDDESDTEKMASKLDILRDSGIEVVTVSRVDDALPALRTRCDSLDLVVLDIIMPPEDTYTIDETDGGTATGLRLLPDIRSTCPEIPVIIVSIKRTQSAESIAQRYHVADYLDKPVEAFEIVEAIKRVVPHGGRRS